MFRLRFFFSGVWCFVPDRPVFYEIGDVWHSQEPESAWILAPLMGYPVLADWERNPVSAPPFEEYNYRTVHKPILVVPERNVVDAHLATAFHRRLAHTPYGDSRLATSLGRSLVTISDADSSGLRAERKLVDPASPKPQDRDEEKSLWWLPSLAEITDSPGQVASENNPDLGGFSFQSSAIDAGIKLSGGTIAVHAFHTKKNGKIRTWEFAGAIRDGVTLSKNHHLGGRWNKALANVLVWEVEVAAESAVISFSTPGGTSKQFQVAPTWRHGVVDLWLRHEEPMDFMKDESGGPAWQEQRLPNTYFDPDFQDFYRLLDTDVPLDQRRYPYNAGSPMGLQGRPCSPGGAGGF